MVASLRYVDVRSLVLIQYGQLQETSRCLFAQFTRPRAERRRAVR